MPFFCLTVLTRQSKDIVICCSLEPGELGEIQIYLIKKQKNIFRLKEWFHFDLEVILDNGVR